MEKDQEMLTQRKILGMESMVEVVPTLLLAHPHIRSAGRERVDVARP